MILTNKTAQLNTTQKHKIKQNKTSLVQWPFTTLDQETRWACSTTLWAHTGLHLFDTQLVLTTVQSNYSLLLVQITQELFSPWIQPDLTIVDNVNSNTISACDSCTAITWLKSPTTSQITRRLDYIPWLLQFTVSKVILWATDKRTRNKTWLQQQYSSHIWYLESTSPPRPLYFHDSEWVSEQCFTSPPTQYRLYGRRFLQVKRPNQQYQSTEGR